MGEAYAHPEVLVSADWLEDHLKDPKVRIVESDEDILARKNPIEVREMMDNVPPTSPNNLPICSFPRAIPHFGK